VNLETKGYDLTAIFFSSCAAISFMYTRMSLKWVLEHQFSFLKALLFVIMDLTSEVSIAHNVSLLAGYASLCGLRISIEPLDSGNSEYSFDIMEKI
jgi:transformation/transcription domain-associated protein